MKKFMTPMCQTQQVNSMNRANSPTGSTGMLVGMQPTLHATNICSNAHHAMMQQLRPTKTIVQSNMQQTCHADCLNFFLMFPHLPACHN